MHLLGDLKMSLLNVNFVMIYIIHKMLELLKNHLKIVFSNAFLRSIIEFLSLEEGNIIKGKRNVFRLEKTKLHCNIKI